VPHLAGFSHIALSVRVLERSVAWYADVFGFELLERIESDAWGFREAVLVHAETGMVVCLQRHDRNAGEAFDPRRTGLDHVAFKVADRAELDRWAERLSALRVTHSPIAERQYGAVLCLRDPDEIQLEIFFRPSH
jgi:glyoxylase I family protein